MTRRALLLAALAAVALAVLARLVLGPAVVAYDGLFSLLWGRDLAEGRLPDLGVDIAPTPHPLSNLVGAVCALLGLDGEAVLRTLSFLSLGVLGVAVFALGREAWSAAVGVVAAAILLTRPQVQLATLISGVDVPFLALVASAAVLALRARGSGAAVLVLLALAGLLRPEAWPLAALYGVVLARRSGRWTWVIAGLAAPLLWMAADLAITGDPLHSLNGTRSLAAELDRPRSFDYALFALPVYVEDILLSPVFWAGVGGLLVALVVDPDRVLVPALAVPVAILGFLVVGAAGLPVLLRYALLPALALAIFAGIGVAGWTRAPSAAARTAWIVGAGALVAWALADAGTVRRGTDGIREFAHAQADAASSLTALARTPRARRAIERCGRIEVPSNRLTPLLAYRLDRPATTVVLARVRRARPAAVFVATDERTRRAVSLPVPGRDVVPSGPPPGLPAVASGESWLLFARC